MIDHLPAKDRARLRKIARPTEYRFELVCPGCNKYSATVADKRIPTPVLKCGDCLMDRCEIVELKVIAVSEQPKR